MGRLRDCDICQVSISSLERKLKRAVSNVNEFLKGYRLSVEDCKIEKRSNLKDNSLASWEYPDKILVSFDDVSESVIAHELVHVLQGTLETFKGFKYLYSLLSEGLAEYVAKQAYPEHEIKYKPHYQIVSILYEMDSSIVKDIIVLNGSDLVPEDIDILLNSTKVHRYFKRLVSPQRELIKKNIKAAIEGEINDPTFVTFGEEIRAWKIIIQMRFDLKREEISTILDGYFRDESKDYGEKNESS